MLVLPVEGVLATGAIVAVLVVALKALFARYLDGVADAGLALVVTAALFVVLVVVTPVALTPGLVIEYLLWGMVAVGVTVLVRHGLARAA